VDVLDEYLRALATGRQKSPATLRAYGADLRGFGAWLSQREHAVTAVTRHELRRYLVELEQQGLAATSVQRKLASLRGLFGWLQRQGRMDKDPAKLLKGPKAPKRVPRFLTTPEVDALLGQSFDDTEQAVRDRAILETLYSTGCRVSECAGMTLAALDLDEGVARVVGKGRKQRLALLGRPAVDAVAAWLPARRQLLRRAKRTDPGALWLNHRGTQLSARWIFQTVVARAHAAGLQTRLTPRIPHYRLTV
jgi:site-specific recombinase XerD